MGYNNLSLDEYAHLSMENAAQLPLEGTSSGGGTSDGTCLYDATAIANIKSVVDAMKTDVATIKSTVDGLATDVTDLKPIINIMMSYINNMYSRMPTSGTVSTLTAQEIPTVAEIQNGLAKTSDIPTISNLETVTTAIKAKTDNLPAEPAAKSDVQITVNADGIDVPTVSDIWNHTNRTLTSTIPTVSDIQSGLAKTSDLSSLAKTSDLSGLATSTNLSALQTTANAIKTQTDKIPATAVTPSDITALRTHGDSNWSTATGFATPADISTPDLSQVNAALTFITALLGNWTVSGNILTTYDDSGAVLKTYALTRDSNNNIISISEA
ncbi:MAG: hypothetical protein Q4D62_12950 [Planctomycetia bacterium]|nr:hypothetical protein [Planctomycetia bacterium]